jgi:hypothetical protein
MNGAGFLIDTNVLSELDKPYPDRRVTRFFDETDDALLSSAMSFSPNSALASKKFPIPYAAAECELG